MNDRAKVLVAIQSEPLELDAVASSVRTDGDGAVALFAGTVRDSNLGRRVLWLEYEAWPELAEREMRRLAHDALQRFGLSGVAMRHRTGRLEIGETSVVIAAAAAHRAQALDACRWLIDTFKREVPIWKKEIFEGGEAWIEGESPTESG